VREILLWGRRYTHNLTMGVIHIGIGGWNNLQLSSGDSLVVTLYRGYQWRETSYIRGVIDGCHVMESRDAHYWLFAAREYDWPKYRVGGAQVGNTPGGVRYITPFS